MRRLLHSLVTLISVVAFVGCASSRPDPRPVTNPVPDLHALPYVPESDLPLQQLSPRLPWEDWPLGRDLEGRDLRNALLVEGDGFVRNGDRASALLRYESVEAAGLTPAEQEAHAIRLASMHIALGNGAKALAALTTFFSGRGQREQDVDGRFSIVFAYAYARKGDTEQSLAWFSRAYRTSGRLGGFGSAAEQGVDRVLRSAPDTALQAMTAVWSGDAFIRGRIAQEVRRRADGGVIAGHAFSDLEAVVSMASTAPSSTYTIAALLPLSGRFSKLGTSVQRGIEIAHRASPLRDQVSFTFVDTTSEPGFSQEPIRRLLASTRVNAVIGPLLAEHAETAGAIVQPTGIPLIALSRSARFSTGGSILRLGPTAASQVGSLLEVAVKGRGLLRIAMVYPADQSGQELADAFRERLRLYGMQPLYEASYPRSDPNSLIPIAQAVEELRPQAVFFPDSILNASRFFASFRSDIRASIVPLGVSTWDDPGQLANSRTVLDGAIFVTPFFSVAERVEIKTFVDSFRATFGERPDFLAAQGFDVGTLILSGIERQGESGLLNALYGLPPYDGLTGVISLSPSGEFDRAFSVVQFQGGLFTELRGLVAEDDTVRAQLRPALVEMDFATEQRYEAVVGE